jgi:RHS repeat-associated protein
MGRVLTETRTRTVDGEVQNLVTAYQYDTMGRQTARVLPLGQRETFSYNAAGERSGQIHFNGHSINASFDALGRIETLTLPEGQRNFEYSASGQIARIDDHGQIYGYTYDERDRLIQAVDPYGRSIDYAYDANGNRVALGTQRQQISYAFDPLNRLSEVSAIIDGSAPQTTTYQYDVNGNRAGQTHPNGTTVDYSFDIRNRLKTLIHRAGTGATAAVLLSLSYTVDASGLRTQIAETRPGTTSAITRTTNYAYDQVKRLTREVVTGSGSQARSSTWIYDSVGNRLRETSSGTISRLQQYTYDANDRLTAETGTQPAQYSYDPAGNMLEKRNGATVLASYQWDSEDRLQSATLNPGASQTHTSYAYDPNGIRRASEVDDGSSHSRTEYLIDPNQAYAQVLEEWGAATTPAQPFGALEAQALYLHGDDLISQTRLHAELTSTHVYHYDGLGTTRALSDETGAITDRYTYTAFGTVDPAGTSGNNSHATENPYQYTGEQLDEELGWYYLRARYMDPGVGRFVGMDPFRGVANDPRSLHKYSYVLASPPNGVDPTGLYTSDFGRRVESYVCDEYISWATEPHTAHMVTCGQSEKFDFDGNYFKPDLFDLLHRRFGEIKPTSPSGISSGIAQITKYEQAYGPLGWDRIWGWSPRTTIVDGERVYFFNVEGIVFYTNLEGEKRAFQGVILSDMARRYRQYWKSQRGLQGGYTPIGPDAAAARAVLTGVGLAAAAAYSLKLFVPLQVSLAKF